MDISSDSAGHRVGGQDGKRRGVRCDSAHAADASGLYGKNGARLPVRLNRAEMRVGFPVREAVAALAALVLAGCGDLPPQESHEIHESLTVPRNMACSKSRDDLQALMRAYSTSDVEAVVGLISRGKAIQIRQGAKADLFYRENVAVQMELMSGSNSGEICWIFESMLKP